MGYHKDRLGPLLFLIQSKYNMTSNVLKFADDTKVLRRVNNDGDKQHLQNDLDKLVKCSEKWLMLLNFWKCKCLHTGHGKLDVNYKMGNIVLGTTVKANALGVTISAHMKVSEQCGNAASKGDQILGLIRRTTLETRRLRGDQVGVFKILNGYKNIDIPFYSLKNYNRTR